MMENTALQSFLVLTEVFKRNKACTKISRVFKFKYCIPFLFKFSLFLLLKYNASQQCFTDIET